ncbi:MAG: PAS domain S-box protein [Burkholderiales bacterium]
MTGTVTHRPDGAGGEITPRVARAVPLALRVLLVGAICYLSTEVGFAHKFPPHYISPLWPTGAILFSVLVVAPVRHWWAYILAAYFTSIINDARAGFPISAILFVAAGIIEILVAAVGVRRFADGLRAFDSLRNLVAYVVIAAVLAPFISAFVGAFAGGAESYGFYWRAWFLSEALAYLTLAPAILTSIGAARTASGRAPLARLIEACLIGGGLLAVGFGVFSWPTPGEATLPALVYLPLPFLLWAAVRFGPAGVNASLLIVAFLSISGTVRGHGPFVTSSPAENVLALQLFLVVISLPLMFLAALIAERRARTNVLRESEARFRSMADAAPVLIWMSGGDRLCTFLNKTWLDFTGRTSEQEVGNGWTEGVHPDDLERCLAAYGDAFAARREFTLEYRLRRHDGEFRWVSDKGVPRLAPDGTFLGYIGCVDDVTERKLTGERTGQVLEATPNAMIVVTREGTITLVNAAAETVFGYAREELIGRPIEMLIPERFRARHPDDRGRYFADPTARTMGAGRELFGRRKYGGEVPVEIGLTPLRTSEGLFTLASIIDVTARKEAELDAQRHRAELAHVTRLSTMGELAASLAHELNQPLTAILSNVQTAQHFLASDPADLDEVREILKDVVADDKRASEVIRRLRALVRKEQPAFAPLDLGGVIGDVVLLLRSDAALRSSRVSVEADPGVPPVQGDRIELQQVALNLLVNAFDAMKDCPAHQRHVVVRATADGTRMVKVAVRDRGTGLGADDLERVFQPFYTTKREGLGMGLAISRAIIEAHGGRLWVENNPDRGATFYFTVPVGEAPTPSGPPRLPRA